MINVGKRFQLRWFVYGQCMNELNLPKRVLNKQWYSTLIQVSKIGPEKFMNVKGNTEQKESEYERICAVCMTNKQDDGIH